MGVSEAKSTTPCARPFKVSRIIESVPSSAILFVQELPCCSVAGMFFSGGAHTHAAIGPPRRGFVTAPQCVSAEACGGCGYSFSLFARRVLVVSLAGVFADPTPSSPVSAFCFSSFCFSSLTYLDRRLALLHPSRDPGTRSPTPAWRLGTMQEKVVLMTVLAGMYCTEFRASELLAVAASTYGGDVARME